MRVILKPGGLLSLLVGVTTLALIAFGKIQSASRPIGAVADTGAKKAAVADVPAAKDEGETAVLTPRRSGDLVNPTSQAWSLATQEPARARMSLFKAADLPYTDNKHALHLDILFVDPNKYWAAQLIKAVPDPVPIGHIVVVHFWGRSRTRNQAHVVFEEGQPPHTPELSRLVSFVPEWRAFRIPFVTTKDNIVVHANFCVKASITPGEIEIAQVFVEDKGPVK